MFLYILMRDHLTPGATEGIWHEVRDLTEAQFSNGWLAGHAADLETRLIEPVGKENRCGAV